ncbi:protein kinase, partial [Rhodococcus sp. NPDC003318]|uniref:protein kinase domain-containing protein n=1 Tax=Rhodococcus sp. NPDC003318 TaxID=3364503 RepID=UPI0036885CE5
MAELGDAGFEDVEEIGRGGFGVVYRCRQPTLHRTVAVKVLAVEPDEENRARFLREQRAMGRLTGHPNIVGILDVGTTASGHPYLVMGYHQQDSIDARIRRHGPLSVEEVLRLGVRMAGALESAHRMGIVHRDVKPANILVTDYGEPVLSDFGIAHMDGGFTTATGSIAGSPAFTAPEVLGGDPSTPAADVYGLGATLFAACTGHAVFERRSGEDVVAQFIRIATEPVPDLSELGVGGDVAAVLERAMARDPAERPSAFELGEQLARLQSDRGLPVDEVVVARETGPTAAGDAGPLPLVAHATDSARVSGRVARQAGAGTFPAEVTTFVGRRAEVREARALLGQARLVTLTGIGGVGKTRLSLRVAVAVRRDFSDGVWLVDLGDVQDGALIGEVVAAVLGVRPQPWRPLIEVLVDALSSREMLVVLDNCEQVVADAATFVDELLTTCPKLRVLATSREALGIRGEQVMRVPPLAVPEPGDVASGDAVGLFADRGATALPGFVVSDANASAVVGICRHLDGLPLAIELAAARLRVMSPDQILQRLTDRYALLGRGSRDLPGRQQTLRACIDWSYELCTEAEQRLWACLSVFAGSFELDAAEHVAAGEVDEVVDVLTALIDKSILIRETAGSAVRFRMLESLREYGREKSEQAGTRAAHARRHRDWYHRLALDADAEWIGPRQLDWIDRLDREQPNLREALEFALGSTAADVLDFVVALQQFWFACNGLGEGRYWVDRVLAAAGDEASLSMVKALCHNCILAEVQGDAAAGAASVARAEAVAARLADPVAHAWVDLAKGRHSAFVGDLAGARGPLERALEAFSAWGDVGAQVLVLLAVGWVRELGDGGAGLATYEEVLAITESHGEAVYRSQALCGIAVSSWRRGDRQRARRAVEQALRLIRPRRDPFIASACLEVMAWGASADGDHRRAATLMGAAQALGQVGNSIVVFAHMLDPHAECEGRARESIGSAAFDRAYAVGRKLDFDEAVDLALGERSRPAPAAAASPTDLTRREREVAGLVAEGLT